MQRIFHFHDYQASVPAQRLVLGMRSGNSQAIAAIAAGLAATIRESCTIVPIPNSCGYALNTLQLAAALTAIKPDCHIADIIRGNVRPSVYVLKKQGKIPDAAMMGYYLTGHVPEGNRVFLLDNVVATGLTAWCTARLIPAADVLVYALDYRVYFNSPYSQHFNTVRLSPAPANFRLRQQADRGGRHR